MKTNPALEGLCPYGQAIDIVEPDSALAALRSKALMKFPDATAGNYVSKSEEGDLHACEFLDGILSQVEGDDHATRRKMLNSLVRPNSLQHIRDEIVIPAWNRSLAQLAHQREDGVWHCDLAEVLDHTFTEFSAKLVGLINIESNDAIAELREWIHPITAAMNSAFYDNRAEVLARGMDAKNKYIKKYYQPALEHYQSLVAQAERGEISDDDIPQTLMRLIASKANPDYEDPDIAVRESILMFVGAAGTSTQSIMSTVKLVNEWTDADSARLEHLNHPEFWVRALQEAMRLKAPFVEFSARIAIEDTEIEGITVRKGQAVHIHLPRSSRDAGLFGDDPSGFNPMRELPQGLARYGFGFASGRHQCFGLRIVLGNDGKGGAHTDILKRLFALGVRPDPENPIQTLPRRKSELSLDDLTNFVSFPVVFTNWGNSNPQEVSA